jgi:hypothetical protein
MKFKNSQQQHLTFVNYFIYIDKLDSVTIYSHMQYV